MISPKKSILNAQGYEPPLKKQDFLLKLDLNENILGPSPKVLEALKNLSADDIKFYPTYGELINKLAEVNDVEPDMILPTNGADEAINYIFDTFIEQGDTVLTVTPTFSMPKVYAVSTGCNYREIPYKEKWVFPVDEFISNIDNNTKLIIITTPNSPTGECISRESLLKVIEAAPDSIILIDETYSSFAKNNFADLVNEYSNVILTRSMSKDFGLPGIRLGYILTNKQNIDYIKRIISPFSVNIIAAKAAIAALEDKEYFESVKTQIIKSREILTEALKDIAEKVYPGSGNFLLVDFGNNAELFYNRLLNSGIKVKYYKNEPHLENCFRITLPSPEQSEMLLKALQPRELIIFDIDGVLVDTRNSYRAAIKSTYEYFSRQEISFEEIQQAKNLGGLNNDWDLTEYLLEKSGINISKESIINKFQEFYFGNNGDGLILNEELLLEPEILFNLAKDYDLAIFTGRPKIEAEFVLRRWNLMNLFSAVITMDDVPEGFHKPDPYGINRILEVIPSKNTYFLGDTPDDVISARQAGINGIGVLPPQDKSMDLKNRLLTEGAMVVLEHTKDIINFMGAVNYAHK